MNNQTVKFHTISLGKKVLELYRNGEFLQLQGKINSGLAVSLEINTPKAVEYKLRDIFSQIGKRPNVLVGTEFNFPFAHFTVSEVMFRQTHIHGKILPCVVIRLTLA